MAASKKSTKKIEATPKALNAFDAYFALKNKTDELATVTKNKKKMPLRDESITRICANCGKEYHPTRNGYANVSKYCSQKCTMAKVSGKFTLN